MIKVFVKQLFLTVLLLTGSALVNNLHADPPPPPPGGGHGQAGNQTGGGAAPLGGGIALLLTMGAAYGVKRVFDARKRLAE